MGQQLVQIRVS